MPSETYVEQHRIHDLFVLHYQKMDWFHFFSIFIKREMVRKMQIKCEYAQRFNEFQLCSLRCHLEYQIGKSYSYHNGDRFIKMTLYELENIPNQLVFTFYGKEYSNSLHSSSCCSNAQSKIASNVLQSLCAFCISTISK